MVTSVFYNVAGISLFSIVMALLTSKLSSEQSENRSSTSTHPSQACANPFDVSIFPLTFMGDSSFSY